MAERTRYELTNDDLIFKEGLQTFVPVSRPIGAAKDYAEFVGKLDSALNAYLVAWDRYSGLQGRADDKVLSALNGVRTQIGRNTICD